MFDLLLIILLLGAPVIGSFIGVLAQRYGNKTLLGRSHCDTCGHTLQTLDLIPLASWLFLKRHCRYCSARLSITYPLYELGAAIPVLWAASLVEGMELIASTILGWFLLALTLIDARTQRLPDILTLPLGGLGILFAYFFDHDAIWAHLFGAVVGFFALSLVAFLYQRLRGRVGLGWGDTKLMAALGAWVTWADLPFLLLLASLSAMAWMVILAFTKGKKMILPSARHRVAFGPFLAFAGWIVWLYGPFLFNPE